MEDELRKSVKRQTSQRFDQVSNEEACREGASEKSEQLEAKRRRSYLDFCNSDTGAIVYFTMFAVSGLVLLAVISLNNMLSVGPNWSRTSVLRHWYYQ